MSRGHRVLLLLLGLIATTVLAVLALVVVSELAFVVVFLGCAYGLGRLRISFDARARHRRMQPFLEVLERTGPMDGKEGAYQASLLGNCARLTLDVKPESPVRSGTRVDGWMRFAGDDWYITIKKGLSNQQRLRLQGEIEDILLHCPTHEGSLWIIVVVGVPAFPSPTLVGQISALVDYASRREGLGSHSKPRRDVNIKVFAV